MPGPPNTAARFQLNKSESEPQRAKSEEPFTVSGVFRSCAGRLESIYHAAWEERTPLDKTNWSEFRIQLHEYIESSSANVVLTFIIVASIVLLVVETDATAERGPLDDPIIPDLPLHLLIMSRLVLGIYVLEVGARAYVFRSELFYRGYTTDVCIVAGDLACVGISFAGGIRFTALRLIRFFRFLRLLRLLNLIPELKFLIKGIASSFSSVLWGIVLVCFLVVSFAIFATVTINPVSRKIASKENSTCGALCETAWSSVWMSVLTIAQTILFGDSWGITALEIIQEEPWLLVFFLAAYATVNLASLNLILAAIVDSGAQAREEALDSRRQAQRLIELEREEILRQKLLGLCKVMDEDYSSTLTLTELMHGFDYNTDFRETMIGLNIDKDDLEIFFTAIDKHKHGSVNYKEFLELVTAARRQGSQQILTWMKCALSDFRHQSDINQKTMDSKMQAMLAEIMQLRRSADKPSDKGPTSDNQKKTTSNGAAPAISRKQGKDHEAAKNSLPPPSSVDAAEHDKSGEDKTQQSTHQQMAELIREQREMREMIRQQGELIQLLTQAQTPVGGVIGPNSSTEMPITIVPM